MSTTSLHTGSAASPDSSSSAAANKSKPVCAAVLAAGLSRRMGALNKLVQEIDGVPMVRRVVEHVLASRCERVAVVVGHEADDVRGALSGLPVEFVDNPEYEEGLAASVRAAARACSPGEALLICLGDMPQVPVAVMDQLIEAYRNALDTTHEPARPQAGYMNCHSDSSSAGQFGDRSEKGGGLHSGIAAFQPEHEGRRGNPVLWSPQAVPLLKHLSGDEGARSVLQRLGESVLAVPVQSAGIFMDVDTPEALSEVRRQVTSPADEKPTSKPG